MIELTQEEKRTLEDALWKAAEGIRETQKVLGQIGTRLRLEFQGSRNHIRDLAGFIADHAFMRERSDEIAKRLVEHLRWKG